MPTGAEYRFKYLGADGTWFCDPDADAVLNEYAQPNSVVQV